MQAATCAEPTAAEAAGITLAVVKLPDVPRGFVLFPRRWVIEDSFPSTSRGEPRSAAAPHVAHGVAFATRRHETALDAKRARPQRRGFPGGFSPGDHGAA